MPTIIGVQLKQYRKKSNLSQKQLADSAGVGQSAISEIEAGERRPRIDTIEKLAYSLNCSVEDLIQPKKENSK